MRLIDVEKLLADLKTRRYSKRSLELIESQPEVKAIAIDWLKEYAGKYGLTPYLKYIIQEWGKQNEKSV